MIVIDMELPKTCRSCNLSFDAYGSITEGKCAALRCGVTYMNDRRNPICPIVGEIPDKNGRIVDVENVMNQIRICFTECKLKNVEVTPFILATYIAKAPTILEATV